MATFARSSCALSRPAVGRRQRLHVVSQHSAAPATATSASGQRRSPIVQGALAMPVPTQSSGVTSWLAQLDMFFSKQQRPTAG
ncbi:hypothetical protein HYH03_007438 [Edaphochlamys debaryana]|uniref:Uncharacterized protein n=1 Tax=Edaphochlamys debaryana TaxID=47281 RepID=A0A835Y370_9CHLO|nr:hypothetical protein HYH03_007438 [Edaphochlamys debaryana]|eukprot:KAG2494384.1 hypothetical protein HYH03_007438 [Edaphochlamys debaryana]